MIICGCDGSDEWERASAAAAGLGARLGFGTVRIAVHRPRARHGSPPSTQRCVGDPVELFVKRTRQANARLLAVGSRGHGRIRRALLGSVSGALAAKAPLPVLIVSPRARLAEPRREVAGRAASR